jgi:mono/diheme cytochrome c family protein
MKTNFARVLLVVFAVLTLMGYYAITEPEGEELFVRENCGKCHTLRGQGLGIINLTGVSESRSRAWMRDQIVNPRLHDPHPGMPSFAHLSDREIAALIDYLEGE